MDEDTVELRIRANPATGQVSVTGPLANKILCLGILEAAKGVVLGFDPGSATPDPPPILLARGRAVH